MYARSLNYKSSIYLETIRYKRLKTKSIVGDYSYYKSIITKCISAYFIFLEAYSTRYTLLKATKLQVFTCTILTLNFHLLQSLFSCTFFYIFYFIVYRATYFKTISWLWPFWPTMPYWIIQLFYVCFVFIHINMFELKNHSLPKNICWLS